MLLTNKVVLVTGASQGLGKTLALKIAKEGGKVALLARSKDALEKVKKEIALDNGIAEYFICDIKNLRDIKQTAKDIVHAFGTIDILINNAGIWTTNEIEEKNPERRKEAFEINTLGAINLTYEVLPILKDKNKGYIFNVISVGGESDVIDGDNKDWITYGATKWAMRGFTKDLRNALSNTKIKVTAFFPGGMDTNIFENSGETEGIHNQPWMMKTEDVADIIVFALTRPGDVLMERITVTKVK